MASTTSRATVVDGSAVDDGTVDESAHVEQPDGRRWFPISRRRLRRGSRMDARRIRQLDLLRAFAILLVIGRHLELDRPDGVVGVFAEGWYRLGWIGVDLFFVLSGFLIAGLLLNETSKRGSLDIRRFLVRRGLKIYPLYFMFLGYLIFAPVARAVVEGGSVGSKLSEQLSSHWPHLVFVQNYVDPGTGGHLWSIAVEEHFYLLLPVVVAALGLRHSKKLILVGAFGVGIFLFLRVLSTVTNDPFAATVSATHLRLDGLLFGVALRAALEYYPDQFAKLRRWRLPLFVFGVACWAPNLWVPSDSAWTRTGGLTLTLLGAAAFLLAIYTSSGDEPGGGQVMSHPLVRGLCWVGIFSYAIYLWHVTAIGGLEKVADRTFLVWLGDGQLGWLLSVLMIVAGVLAVGIVVTTAIERPILRLRDRLAPSRAPSLPAPSPGSGGPAEVASAR